MVPFLVYNLRLLIGRNSIVNLLKLSICAVSSTFTCLPERHLRTATSSDVMKNDFAKNCYSIIQLIKYPLFPVRYFLFFLCLSQLVLPIDRPYEDVLNTKFRLPNLTSEKYKFSSELSLVSLFFNSTISFNYYYRF